MRHIAFALVVVISMLAGPCLADGRAFPPDDCSEQTPFMAFTAVQNSNTYCTDGQDIFRNALPTCAPDEFVAFNGTQFACRAVAMPVPPGCGPDQVLTSNGTDLVCVTDNTSTGTSTTATQMVGQPHGYQEFLTSGSFTVPAGVSSVKVSIVGGGGGGNTSIGTSGGNGGRGVAYVNGLTPGAAILVTIGAAGVSHNWLSMTSGGASSFGGYVTATGGQKVPCINSTSCNGSHGTVTGAQGIQIRTTSNGEYGGGGGGAYNEKIGSDDQPQWVSRPASSGYVFIEW